MLYAFYIPGIVWNKLTNMDNKLIFSKDSLAISPFAKPGRLVPRGIEG